tara:strand:+ start:1633 stop:2508 length:876 start_codon:yes stop_codon:yes gene_type:complete
MRRKGILLAGGSGTRLYPITKAVSKQLLPVYDKPMIYYPLSILMLAGINEILLISTPHDIDNYKRLLDDGSKFGIKIDYAIQPSPDGLAQSFIIGENFIDDSNVTLILGDNIFYGQGFSEKLIKAAKKTSGATIFGHRVKDPERFGVVDFDKDMNVKSIEEKPLNPISNYAVTGLYFYDNKVIEIAKSLKPSSRGELEITDVNNVYISNNEIEVNILGRGFTWLDTGTHDSLLEASQFVHSIENQNGYKIACLEEISFKNGWMSKNDILKRKESYSRTNYGKYLLSYLSNS